MNNYWLEFIKKEQEEKYYQEIIKYLKAQECKKVFPEEKDIFKCFEMTNFDHVKVIILGQDPYYKIGQADGLAFSVPSKVKMPPTLKNIYKEIEKDFQIKMSSSGDLSNWARQGVLLLNTILTVEENKPLAHQSIGWNVFSDKVIKLLNDDTRPKVFMLWGESAKKKQVIISNPVHLVLTSSHPSPLGYYRSFKDCQHFLKANQFLKETGQAEINWKN